MQHQIEAYFLLYAYLIPTFSASRGCRWRNTMVTHQIQPSALILLLNQTLFDEFDSYFCDNVVGLLMLLIAHTVSSPLRLMSEIWVYGCTPTVRRDKNQPKQSSNSLKILHLSFWKILLCIPQALSIRAGAWRWAELPYSFTVWCHSCVTLRCKSVLQIKFKEKRLLSDGCWNHQISPECPCGDYTAVTCCGLSAKRLR